MVTSSTLEEALRRSPPFLVSSLAAAIASGIGLLGLLLALIVTLARSAIWSRSELAK
jgi:multisubunit Na+/H+ antiporter MnhB subunit